MTQLDLPLDDKLQRARQIYLENKHYSGMSFHIRKFYDRVVYCSRYYPTFDRPDWTTFFGVTKQEADAIVQAGYATYWFDREDVWNS